MSEFDTFVMVDWSGGNDTGPTPRRDAIWACVAAAGSVPGQPIYHRNRQQAETWLTDLIEAELTAGRRLMIGFDFPFGYPRGFAGAVAGTDDPLRLWDWFGDRIEDAPGANNRFDLAGRINRGFGGQGPFWGNGLKRDIDGLPRTKSGLINPFAERRRVEDLTKGTFTCWQMSGAGSVGGQVFMGLPVLSRLRHRFSGKVSVWPFEPMDTPVALVEIWPSLTLGRTPEGAIRDSWQVQSLAGDLATRSAPELNSMLNIVSPEEGWILGVSQPASDLVQSDPAPPPLRNDCFALPPGVAWTPVDEALALLRDRLTPVTGTQVVPLSEALDRILAEDITARRSNPPAPNSAVDGYGFAGAVPEGAHVLPLLPGRAAAGVPYDGKVPAGVALRVLTGAILPDGVETVILEEDVAAGPDSIAFRGPLKCGANTRRAGEDVCEGDVALTAGRVLTPADLALLSAVGVSDVPVRDKLKVAVLSTGDELAEPGEAVGPGRIFDANRPMLLAMIRRFGWTPVDCGRVVDDREALRAALDHAANAADVILTSGGASAGDEDHVSALLAEAGALQEWRIAVKPGRPLALGIWEGKPLFGLPGNPVAAMVCTLVFARPAMACLAGAGWPEPQGFLLPAGFEKNKKPGRREYLRARLRDGQAEAFASEGSGRISGLSWAEGLVELPDGAARIRKGDPVRFIPYAGFGL